MNRITRLPDQGFEKVSADRTERPPIRGISMADHSHPVSLLLVFAAFGDHSEDAVNVLWIKRLGSFDERLAFRRRISVVMQHHRRAEKIGGDARLAVKKAAIKTECLVCCKVIQHSNRPGDNRKRAEKGETGPSILYYLVMRLGIGRLQNSDRYSQAAHLAR